MGGNVEVKFTKQQLADWRKYEAVRQSGKWNMWFPQGRQATKLPDERYIFVLKNYQALRDAQPKEKL